MTSLETLLPNADLSTGAATDGLSVNVSQEEFVQYALIQASIEDAGQLVDAEPVRSHIRMLMDAGMSMKDIAVLSGVSRSILGRVLYGTPSKDIPPQKNISESSYLKILCVTTDMISDEMQMMDAVGTIRRMQALATLGYATKVVAQEAGVGYFTLVEINKRKRVRVGVAHAVAEAYDRLSIMEPPALTQAEKSAISKTKTSASKNKWLSPLAWRDSDIDDPEDEGRMRCECLTVNHQHGTRDAYLTDKCRCTPCQTAYRAIINHGRRMEAYGRSTKDRFVDASPARKHVDALMGRGWTVDRIAKDAGVGRNTICRLIYGEPAKGTGPTATMKSSTSQKLLKFSPEESRERGAGTARELVNSIGTIRRIQSLMACGYSMTLIAKEAGTSKRAVSKIMQSEKVRSTTAESFKSVYDKVWNIAPPQRTSAEKKGYTLAKKMAAQNHWVPPMAWDDDEIDDPSAKPFV